MTGSMARTGQFVRWSSFTGSQTVHFPARNLTSGQVSVPTRLDRVDDVEQGQEQDLTGAERGDRLMTGASRVGDQVVTTGPAEVPRS